MDFFKSKPKEPETFDATYVKDFIDHALSGIINLGYSYRTQYKKNKPFYDTTFFTWGDMDGYSDTIDLTKIMKGSKLSIQVKLSKNPGVFEWTTSELKEELRNTVQTFEDEDYKFDIVCQYHEVPEPHSGRRTPDSGIRSRTISSSEDLDKVPDYVQEIYFDIKINI